MTTLIRRGWYPKVLDIVAAEDEIRISDVVDDIVRESVEPETIGRLVKDHRTKLATNRLRAVCANEKIYIRSSAKHVFKVLKTESDFRKELERLRREERAASARRHRFEVLMRENGYPVPIQTTLFDQEDSPEQSMNVPAFVQAVESSEEPAQPIGH